MESVTQAAADDTNMTGMDMDMNMDVDAGGEPICEDKKECQEIVELLLSDEQQQPTNSSDNNVDVNDVNFTDMMVEPIPTSATTGGGGECSRGSGSFRQVSDSTTGGNSFIGATASSNGGGIGGGVIMDPTMSNAFDDDNLNYFDVDADDVAFGDDDVSTGFGIASPNGAVVSSVGNGVANPTASGAASKDNNGGLALTGRPGIPLYLSCNPDHLSLYQSEIRKHIQFFEATPVYVNNNQQVKGRNKAIVLGQVGIQCVHCSFVLPLSNRSKGNMYFPQKLIGIYQASQILSTNHLLESCQHIPASTRETLKEYQSRSQSTIASSASKNGDGGSGGNLVNSGGRTAGKEYWSKTAQALGVYEDEHGLRFKDRLPSWQEMKDMEAQQNMEASKKALEDEDDDDV